jgi:hypothetical protein
MPINADYFSASALPYVPECMQRTGHWHGRGLSFLRRYPLLYAITCMVWHKVSGITGRPGNHTGRRLIIPIYMVIRRALFPILHSASPASPSRPLSASGDRPALT